MLISDVVDEENRLLEEERAPVQMLPPFQRLRGRFRGHTFTPVARPVSGQGIHRGDRTAPSRRAIAPGGWGWTIVVDLAAPPDERAARR